MQGSSLTAEPQGCCYSRIIPYVGGGGALGPGKRRAVAAASVPTLWPSSCLASMGFLLDQKILIGIEIFLVLSEGGPR